MEKKFLIEGMTCASCVILNKKTLENISGISKSQINLATKEANIIFDETKINFEEIKKEIESNGFKVNENIKIDNLQEKVKNKKIFLRFIFSLIFSIPVFLEMFFKMETGVNYFGVDINMYILPLFSAIVVFIFGGHFHKNAFKSLLKLHFNMDSLVSLGTLIAFFYSIIAMFFNGFNIYFETAVSIIILINLGKYLENNAKTKAGDAIGRLLELGVKNAFILEDGNLIEKEIDNIKLGEIIVVKPGEKIALDGEIIEGNANCDESMLTGESIPIFKEIGNNCFGGTINLDGNLKIKVSKTNKNGTLANIIALINEAQSSKSPIEHLADKVSSIFVPTIIVMSILTFVVWYFISGDISKAIITSVTSLVIACPCALGLATPTAIMVGTGVGAKNGILIKNAEILEKTKDIDCIVFDKTGTITNGKPEVIDIINFCVSKQELISLAKSLCILSNHPLSKAISNYGKNENIYQVSNFEEIKGKGIIGEISKKTIKLGNQKLFVNITENIILEIEKLTESGKTPIIIGNEKEILGIISLLDLPKNGVEKTINKLKSMKIEVIMLTGDTKKTAEFIAKKIGIQNIIAEVMPEDKLNIIKDLQKQNKKIAFVGDGINDAPALMQADLSIAMGTGSDIAIESAGIVLLKGDLNKVVLAINLSRETLKIIKQNLFWAFVYNSIGIPLAILGILNPIFASFAMSMSSVSVISNSLRLKFFKK
ncbi:MAG: heavy metal translocating P-type ATPase [Candidatus Gracilibacteria bacterium]|nr:heavy metal translocating P-type ATPase [Candidatus Gracilibacteria bacterium]